MQNFSNSAKETFSNLKFNKNEVRFTKKCAFSTDKSPVRDRTTIAIDH